MPRNTFKRWLYAALIVLTACYFARKSLPLWDSWKAQRLLAEIKTNANSRSLLQLADLLDRRRLPKDLGDEVLRRLISPQFLVRDQYVVGQKVVVGVATDREVIFRRLMAKFSGKAMAGNEVVDRFDDLSFSSPPGTTLLQFTRALNVDGKVVTLVETGKYSGQIVVGYQLCSPPTRSRVQDRTTADSTIDYACELTFAVNLRLYIPADVGPVKCVSDVKLDQEMKGVFSLDSRAWRPAPPIVGTRSEADSHSLDDSESLNFKIGNQIRQRLALRYTRLPADVSFGARFRDRDGNEYLSQSFRFVARAGSDGIASLDSLSDIFQKLTAGRHQGELILSSDPYAAREHPQITSVWSGQISLPVEIAIESENTNGVKLVDIRLVPGK